MVIIVLVVVGLCLGSFINALIWRLHEQETPSKKPDKANKADLSTQDMSILKGRSMCPNCHHALAVRDLIPVISWLSLRGKCRYCAKSIAVQYPIVELATALLFIGSYALWPVTLRHAQIAVFILWLPLLTGLIALLVYDMRWKLLPSRIIYPLGLIAAIQAIINILAASEPLTAFLNVILAVLVGGGVFYLLLQVSDGKWIGGGDVRLGWLLGLIVATPAKAVLVIFLASAIGSILSLPLLISGRLKRTSTIPFGPFLIIAGIISVLFGGDILSWYRHTFIIY